MTEVADHYRTARLRELDWRGEPPAAIEAVAVFGPAPADVVE